jgi:hypothetical protein
MSGLSSDSAVVKSIYGETRCPRCSARLWHVASGYRRHCLCDTHGRAARSFFHLGESRNRRLCRWRARLGNLGCFITTVVTTRPLRNEARRSLERHELEIEGGGHVLQARELLALHFWFFFLEHFPGDAPVAREWLLL